MRAACQKLVAGLLAVFIAFAASTADAQQSRRVILLGPPGWVKTGAVADLDFANGRYFGCTLTSCLSITRASQKTNLLPFSASGFAYTTFANNTLAITPGLGLLIEESRTNQLLNSAVPATQTTGSLGTATYTLWVNGSGSATMSAGTGTGCGTGTATQGTPVNFTITIAGTCTVTVTGSLNAFQLEAGAFGTSFIITIGAAGTRNADNISGLGNLLTAYKTAGVTQYSKVPAQPAIAPGNNGYTGAGFNIASAAFRSTSTAVGVYNGTTITAATIGGSGNFTTTTINSVGSFDGTGDSIVANGGSEATSANTFPAITTVTIGSNGASGSYLDWYLSRIAVWPSRLPASTRILLSQN